MNRSIEVTFGDGFDNDTLFATFGHLTGMTIKVNDDEATAGESIIDHKGITTMYQKGLSWWISSKTWDWDEITEIHVY